MSGTPRKAAQQREAAAIAAETGADVGELLTVGGNGLRQLVPQKAEILRNPAGVLEELNLAMARALALEEILEQKVFELKAEDWKDLSVFGQVAPRIQLYEKAIERVQRFIGDYIRLQVEVRRMTLDEQQGALIAEVLRRVFDDPDLGLDESSRRKARQLAAQQLRVIGGVAG